MVGAPGAISLGSGLLLPLAFGVGAALWAAASLVLGVAEPWDTEGFWPVYGIALALSTLFGAVAVRRAWLPGVLIIWALLPVMLFHSGPGPLLPVGLMFLAVLSLPAAIVGLLARRFRRAQGRRRAVSDE